MRRPRPALRYCCRTASICECRYEWPLRIPGSASVKPTSSSRRTRPSPVRQSSIATHKHSNRNQFRVAECSTLLSAAQSRLHLLQRCAFANASSFLRHSQGRTDRLARFGHASFSCRFACCHSSSSSSMRRLLGPAAAGAQPLFHPLKAPFELSICLAQRRLRIKREIARDVDQHKKKIANLVLQSLVHFGRYLRLARPGNALPGGRMPFQPAAFSSSRNSAVSSASFSNSPSISGQSNPTRAARELSLCASSSAGARRGNAGQHRRRHLRRFGLAFPFAAC